MNTIYELYNWIIRKIITHFLYIVCKAEGWTK